MINALSFDVEDWFQVENLVRRLLAIGRARSCALRPIQGRSEVVEGKT
jgi:hypothetical protein